MASFQQIVVLVAAFLLLVFIILSIFFYRNRKQNRFPPFRSDCPDYWVNENGSCVNKSGMGKSSCETNIDFRKGQWVGDKGLCSKKAWAKSCNITWDGISNNESVKC